MYDRGGDDAKLFRFYRELGVDFIVLAAAYFACVWLGRRVKSGLIVRALLDMPQRMGRLGGFVCGVLAHGIRRAFVRGGRWRGLDVVEAPKGVDDRQMLLDFSG